MVRLFFSAFLTIVLPYTPVTAQYKTIDQQALHWADSVLKTMKTDEKIGQLFMVATYSSGNEQHHHAIEQFIATYHIGGLIFMQGSPVRQAHLTNRFQSQSDLPLFIGMDMEWGLGMRLDSTIHFPKQMTLGAIQDNSLIYNMGKEIGSQMRRLGVNVAFAPVVDINSNPLNPVIGIRSFGENQELVSEKAKAYMNGLQDAGVIAVAKHFPGHGDTQVDSHESLPTIMASKTMLLEREIKPYTSLIQNGLKGIMTGHLHVPALEEGTKVPATLSENIVESFLKQDIGFRGLVFTDALNMKAISSQFDNGEAELQAFSAGNDILLFSTQIPVAIKKIKKVIRRNSELKDRLNRSVRKILAFKYETLHRNRPVINTDNLTHYLNNNEAKALRHKLYQQAATIVKNKDGKLPIKKLDNRHFASLTFDIATDFNKALEYYTSLATYDYRHDQENVLFEKLINYETVVVGVFDRLSAEQKAFLGRLSKSTHIIICHAGSSYSLVDLSMFNSIVHIEENNKTTQYILAEVVFGARDTTGKIPVSVDEKIPYGTGINVEESQRLSWGIAESVGMSSRVLNKIDGILKEAVQDCATPGGQVLVAREGQIVYENNFGYYTYDSVNAVSSETIYDVASITKVAATLQAFMFLHERGEIDLEKKLSNYLPELKGTNKEHMLLLDILTHQAGLWPYLPFWKQTVQDSTRIEGYYSTDFENEFQYHVAPGLYATNAIKDSVWSWVKNSKIITKADKRPYAYRYSDMGYYLLQRLIEKSLNQDMEQFLQQNFYGPLGMSSTGYLPLCNFPLSRMAPTEKDNYFRNTLVYGMVHDQGAALLGGVAGHAGLFSNARDLAKLMQMHLQGGTYGGHRFLQPGTIGLFSKQQYESNRRGIGWDKPATAQWYGPSSRFASAKTFGHTGFTGTAAWADPEFDLVYIFLSNRIHPDASNRKLIQNNIRTRIQEVIYESIWEYEQYDCDE
ncbi:MAG: glycoside hydrolase family 3 N-terminal domain-containing protein [Bacteroidota bacterium]